MAREITVDIAATGSIDSSFAQSMQEMQEAIKAVKSQTEDAGVSFTQLNKTISSQRSVLRSLQQEYAATFASGNTAGADKLLEQIITMKGAMAENKQAVESVKNAMEMLNNIDDETAAGISKLTREIADQEQSVQDLLSEYNKAVDTYGLHSKEAKDLSGEISQLNSKLESNKNALSDQMEAAKKAAQETSQFKEASESLGDVIDRQKSDLASLKNEYANAYSEQGKNSAAAKELASEIQKLSTELNQNENKFQEANLAADSFDKTIRQTSESTKSMSSWMSTALGNLASSGIQMAADKVGDFGKGIFEVGMGFESEMSKVAGISKASESDLARLSQAAKDMGSSTIFSSTEAAEALEYMALAGWDTNKSIESLEPVLKLAAGAGMDLGAASDLVTDFMGAFSNSEMSVEQFANKLVIASTSSNTAVDQMGEAFRNSASSMNAMGQSIDTTSAILTVLADNGIKGSEAGTQLSAIMRDLNNSMENGAIKIGNTSVAVADAQGNYRQLTDIMKDVEAATQGMSETERTAAMSSVFTADSQKAMFTVLNAGTDAIAQRVALLSNETMDVEALNRLYQTQTDNLEGSLKIFHSGVEAVQGGIYEAIKPLTKMGVDWINQNIMPALTNFVAKLQGINWEQALSGFHQALEKVASSFSGFFGKVDFSSVGKSLSQAFNGIDAGKAAGFAGLAAGALVAVKAIGKVKTALSGGFKVSGGDPFSAMSKSASGFKLSTVSTITAVTGAFQTLAGNKDTVIPFLSELSGIFQDLAGGVLSGIADFINKVAQAFDPLCSGIAKLSPIVEAFGNVFNGVIGALSQAATSIIPVLSQAAGFLIDKLAQAAQTVLPVLGDFINKISKSLPNISSAISKLSPMVKTIGDVAGTIIEALGKAVADILPAFGDFLAKIADVIPTICDGISKLSPLIDSFGNAFSKVIETLGHAVSEILPALNPLIETLGNIFTGVVQIVGDTIAKIVEVIAPYMPQITEMISNISDSFADIVDSVSDMFNQISPILDSVRGIFEELGEQIRNALDGVAGIIQELGDAIRNAFDGVSDIIDSVAGAIESVGTAVKTGCEGVADIIKAIGDAINEGFEGAATLVESIGTAFESLGDGVKSGCEGVQGIIEGIGHAVKDTLDGCANIVDSLGNAAKDAGIGFEHFANGLETICGIDIVSLASHLGLLIGALMPLVLENIGLYGLGDNFEHIAQGLEHLTGIDTDLSQLTDDTKAFYGALSTSTDNMGELGSKTDQLSGKLKDLDENFVTHGQNLRTNMGKVENQFKTSLDNMSNNVSSTSRSIKTETGNISNSFQTMANNISRACSQIINDVKNCANTMISSINNACISMINDTATACSSMISNVASMCSSVESSISTVFGRLSGYVQNGMNDSVNSVVHGVNEMASALNTTLRGPDIELPHISVHGNFDLEEGEVPSFDVEWYAKGAIMNSAAIFGASGNSLLAGGEAGQEAILPLEPFWNKLDSFLATIKEATRPTVFSSLDENEIATALSPVTNNTSSVTNAPVINFNPTINIGSTNGDESIQSQISSALDSQRQALMDEVRSYFAEQQERRFDFA